MILPDTARDGLRHQACNGCYPPWFDKPVSVGSVTRERCDRYGFWFIGLLKLSNISPTDTPVHSNTHLPSLASNHAYCY